MLRLALIVAVAALMLFVFLGILTYLIVNEGKKSQKQPKQGVKSKKISSDLDNMIVMAQDKSLNENDFKELATLYVKTHKLGSKTSKDLNEATKKKLEFVSAFASNPKASPQVISFLNRELKKVSNSYAKEIDAYEQMGLAKRKIKTT